MRHICLYTLDPDFHCVRAGGCAGSPEVVQEALADLKSGKDSGTTRLVNNVTDLSYGPIFSRINYCCSEFQQDGLRMNVAQVIKQSSQVYGSF